VFLSNAFDLSTSLKLLALVPGILPGMRHTEAPPPTSHITEFFLFVTQFHILKKSTFPDNSYVFILFQIVFFVFVILRTLHFWRRSLRLNIPGKIPGTRGGCAIRLDAGHRLSHSIGSTAEGKTPLIAGAGFLKSLTNGYRLGVKLANTKTYLSRFLKSGPPEGSQEARFMKLKERRMIGIEHRWIPVDDR